MIWPRIVEPVLDNDENRISDNRIEKLIFKESHIPFLNFSLVVFQSCDTERQISKEAVKKSYFVSVVFFLSKATFH